MVKVPKNKKVGLALGGGAVLGAAHIGVLKAIDELEIEVGWVAGTSIGALVGSFYAFGSDFKNVKEVALNLSWKDITSFSPSEYALFSNNKIEKLLEENIGKKNLEDAEIPLAVVTTDITTGNKVVLQKGNIGQAITASTCIPGVFKPIKKDNQLLVDGGVVENVPTTTVKEMGADFVIAVDLLTKREYERPENMIGILLNSFHITLAHAAKNHAEEASIVIQPDLTGYNGYDTRQTNDLIEIGYKEAMKAIDT